jgi:hypothetical protein
MAAAEAEYGFDGSAELDAPLYGIMAEFDDIPSIVKAAEYCRDAGFSHWDVYAPVPIHGIDEAMGLKPSRVSFTMAGGAVTGFTIAMLMQWWMGAVEYQIITAGKPFFAWEQALPIGFELTVLLSAFGALGGMILLNQLPKWYHPLLAKDRFLRVSDDRLVIAIEARDAQFDEVETAKLLESLGGKHIELVEA